MELMPSRASFSPVVPRRQRKRGEERFLKEKIGWQDIGELVCRVADTFETAPVTSVEDVLEADRKARAYVLERCGESAR